MKTNSVDLPLSVAIDHPSPVPYGDLEGDTRFVGGYCFLTDWVLQFSRLRLSGTKATRNPFEKDCVEFDAIKGHYRSKMKQERDVSYIVLILIYVT